MVLYRYFGSHAFETLKETKLKTSKLSSFNDPFEFLYIATGKMTPEKARKYIEARIDSPDFLFQAHRHFPEARNETEIKKLIRKDMPRFVMNLVRNFKETQMQNIEDRQRTADKNIRIICFSAANQDCGKNRLDEILLWSHYADKHAGIRIGFEFPEDDNLPFMLEQVTYQDKRVEVDLSCLFSRDVAKDALYESAKVKSKAWSYEGEYRLFTIRKLCEERKMEGSFTTTPEHFLDFRRAWVRSVDFGVRCPPHEVQRVVDLVKSEYQNVILRKAQFHKTEYALDYTNI